MRVLPQYLISSLGGRSSYPTGGPVYGGPDTGKPFMGGGGRSSYPTGGPVYGGPDTGKPFIGGGRSDYPMGGPVYGGPDTGKPFIGGGRSDYPMGGPVYGGPDTGKPSAASVEDSDIGKQRLARSRARKFLQSYSGNMTPNIGDSTTYIK